MHSHSARMVEVVSPAPRKRWQEVLDHDRRALPEHSPRWIDALEESLPVADASRLYTFADGQEVVLPLVRKKGIGGTGGWLLSFPRGWGMGGLVGTHDADIARLVLDDLRRLGAQQISILPDPTRWQPWEAGSAGTSTTVIPRRSHVIDLDGGADAVWKRLTKSARRGTRIAERAGVEIRSGRDPSLVEEYYALQRLSVDRWAKMRGQPLSVARALAKHRDPGTHIHAMRRHLGDDFRTTVAYFEGHPVFAAVTTFGATAHDLKAAMDRERIAGSRAGDMVQWTTLEQACARGCTYYHLGESGDSANLALTKEKYSALPYGYGELRVERLPWTQWDRRARSWVKRSMGTVDD